VRVGWVLVIGGLGLLRLRQCRVLDRVQIRVLAVGARRPPGRLLVRGTTLQGLFSYRTKLSHGWRATPSRHR
jgi:hypothetical protein